MPWIGYFALMHSVNKFVILDNVQFEKRSWQQRNKILLNNKELFLTVPVKNINLRNTKLSEVQISTDHKFENKHIDSLKHAYNKSKFYNEYAKDLNKIINNKYKFLIDLNLSIITHFMKIFKINTELLLASSLKTKLKKDLLMYEICEKLKADIYLAAPGSKNYLEKNEDFKKGNIKIEYFEYNHPTYSQSQSSFKSYLSAIDLIFNHGPNSKEILISVL